MLINDKAALNRLNSPHNLINKLKSSQPRAGAMALFGLRPDSSGGIKKLERVESTNKSEQKPFNPFEKVFPRVEEKPAELTLEHTAADIDTILKDSDSVIKLGLAHDKALELLTNAVTTLTDKLPEVKADKLPSVIAAASKTVESIRKERSERDKNGRDREVHFHFYTPEQKKLADYEVIDIAPVGG